MHFMRRPEIHLKFTLLVFLISLLTNSNAQDTTYRRYSFTLFKPADSYNESMVTQYPWEVVQYFFTVPDTSTIYVGLYSENDSLDIRLDNLLIKKRAKQNKKLFYSISKEIYPGKYSISIRTRKPCTYSINVSR